MTRRNVAGLFACACAAVVTAVVLETAFFPQEMSLHAWFALVPLLVVVRMMSPRVAAGWCFVSGWLFWFLTLRWFPAIIDNGGPWPLVVLGWAGLSAVCAAFWAVFGLCSARLWRCVGTAPSWRRVVMVAVADPVMWCGLEWIRSWICSGFAWNFLGVSQVNALTFLQVASVAGVFGVSALVLLLNGALTTALEGALRPFLPFCFSSCPATRLTLAARGWRMFETALPLGAVLLVGAWGAYRVRTWQAIEQTAPVWRVALVQPNTPCVFSDARDPNLTVETLARHTAFAGLTQPDLVVWPESATAEFGYLHRASAQAILRMACQRAGSPVLTGGNEITRESGDVRNYNAAWLCLPSDDGASFSVAARYHKQHLVPFGEYIPFDKTFPWLQRFAPTGVSCNAGTCVVAPITNRTGRVAYVAPLICFEDTVESLSRHAVREGATVLALMTNDAWFDGSCEPVQHARQAVFRCVENGVPMVRAANSGMTCVVSPVGKTEALMRGVAPLVDGDGVFVTPVAIPETAWQTVYTRVGNVPLATLFVFVVAVALWPRKRR